MKNIFTNRKGVTVLEGLIALGLLALVATGTFSVLLSVSRKGTNPDMREEMIYAIEKANNLLQGYVLSQTTDYGNSMASFKRHSLTGVTVSAEEYPENMNISVNESSQPVVLPSDLSNGLCGNSSVNKVTDSTPLSLTTHQIPCLLPPVCDRDPAKSFFTYTVERVVPTPQVYLPSSASALRGAFETEAYTNNERNDQVKITYNISCNGFTL